MSIRTTTQAKQIAARHFNAQDADWNVLGYLAATGLVDPDESGQTYIALTDYHNTERTGPMSCECAIRGQLCDIGKLREYAREVSA